MDTIESLQTQQELPLAFLNGEALIEKPQDLYIPPDALAVVLEMFSGPMDLLLYLIRKQKMDILSLPIADITSQYMNYIQMMQELKLELAAEYLVMASTLAEIKSRMLLPKHESDEEETDPRAELARRLELYEKLKDSVSALDSQPREERDIFVSQGQTNLEDYELDNVPDVAMQDLVLAFASAMRHAETMQHHSIAPEQLSTRERMSKIMSSLTQAGVGQYVSFHRLFTKQESKAGVVVTFMSILELLKEKLIVIVQPEVGHQIYVALRDHAEV